MIHKESDDAVVAIVVSCEYNSDLESVGPENTFKVSDVFIRRQWTFRKIQLDGSIHQFRYAVDTLVNLIGNSNLNVAGSKEVMI